MKDFARYVLVPLLLLGGLAGGVYYWQERSKREAREADESDPAKYVYRVIRRADLTIENERQVVFRGEVENVCSRDLADVLVSVEILGKPRVVHLGAFRAWERREFNTLVVTISDAQMQAHMTTPKKLQNNPYVTKQFQVPYDIKIQGVVFAKKP